MLRIMKHRRSSGTDENTRLHGSSGNLVSTRATGCHGGKGSRWFRRYRYVLGPIVVGVVALSLIVHAVVLSGIFSVSTSNQKIVDSLAEYASSLVAKSPLLRSTAKKSIERRILYSSPGTKLRTPMTMKTDPVTSNCGKRTVNDDIRTTLVTLTSLDRLWVLHETCQRWKDPIVAVMALRWGESASDLTAAMSDNMITGDACPNLTIVEYHMDQDQSAPQNDPLNLLRNVGLDSVETSHVVMLDIDLIPSHGLDETIRSTLEERRSLRKIKNNVPPEEYEAVVIPVFERHAPSTEQNQDYLWLRRNSSFIPKSFQELKMCLNEASCEIVCKYTNYFGHATTKTEDWLQGLWFEDEAEGGLGGDDDDDDDTLKGADMDGVRDGKKPTTARNIRSVKCIDTPSNLGWTWVSKRSQATESGRVLSPN